MPRLTVAELTARRDRYIEAETKILLKQDYSIAGRRLAYADLAEVRAEIEKLDNQIAYLTDGAGARVRGLSLG